MIVRWDLFLTSSLPGSMCSTMGRINVQGFSWLSSPITLLASRNGSCLYKSAWSTGLISSKRQEDLTAKSRVI